MNSQFARHSSQPSTPRGFKYNENLVMKNNSQKKKVKRKRLILPIVAEMPSVGQYTPNLSSIKSNPKYHHMRSLSNQHIGSEEYKKLKQLPKIRKSPPRITILEGLLQQVDDEVKQDIITHPKLQLPELTLKPLSDTFVNNLKYFKLKLSQILRKNL